MYKVQLVRRFPSLSTLARACLCAALLAGVLGITSALAATPKPEPYLVEDIHPGIGGSEPYYLTAVGNTLFFVAIDETHGDELWRSDGTEAGTEMVKDIFPGVNGSQVIFMTATTDALFFGARDETHGTELWRSNGTEAGTELVKDIRTGVSDSLSTYYFTRWLAIDNTLFFVASDGITGFELWRSNGAEENTVLVKDIYPDASDSNPMNLIDVNGVILFSANDPGHGFELWRSDGTAENTVLVKDIYPGGMSSEMSYYSEGWTVVNHTAFFIATDGISGIELWRSDGTAEGTVLVKDINPGYYGSVPSSIINLGGRLFFTAENAAYGEELWQSDGTEAGTELVKDIYPGSEGARPRFLTNVNGRLFFSATNFDYYYNSFLASQQVEAVPEVPFGVELWSLRYLIYVPLVVK